MRDRELARLAKAVVLAAPVAVVEEAVFRWVLTPARVDTAPRRWRAIEALAAFVGWHVVQGAVWPPVRRVFWRADFLAAAALLGAACTLLRIRNGSIWPGVALHFTVIVAWRTLLGGPGFDDLRRSR